MPSKLYQSIEWVQLLIGLYTCLGGCQQIKHNIVANGTTSLWKSLPKYPWQWQDLSFSLQWLFVKL
eukprot:Gb_38323 [translate_table: standard]